MHIDLKNLVSISEANQNFSKVARMVDENGAAVILKNNSPRFIDQHYEEFGMRRNSGNSIYTIRHGPTTH